jgi:hypothetical protein
MSKYAKNALLAAAAESKELSDALKDQEGAVFNHLVAGLLTLSADEIADLKSNLKNPDKSGIVVGTLDERNNPGPGVGSSPVFF